MKVIWILKKRRVATLIKEFGLERKIKIHKTHSLQRKHDSDSPPPSTLLLLYCGSADAGVDEKYEMADFGAFLIYRCFLEFC